MRGGGVGVCCFLTYFTLVNSLLRGSVFAGMKYYDDTKLGLVGKKIFRRKIFNFIILSKKRKHKKNISTHAFNKLIASKKREKKGDSVGLEHQERHEVFLLGGREKGKYCRQHVTYQYCFQAQPRLRLWSPIISLAPTCWVTRGFCSKCCPEAFCATEGDAANIIALTLG